VVVVVVVGDCLLLFLVVEEVEEAAGGQHAQDNSPIRSGLPTVSISSSPESCRHESVSRHQIAPKKKKKKSINRHPMSQHGHPISIGTTCEAGHVPRRVSGAICMAEKYARNGPKQLEVAVPRALK